MQLDSLVEDLLLLSSKLWFAYCKNIFQYDTSYSGNHSFVEGINIESAKLFKDMWTVSKTVSSADTGEESGSAHFVRKFIETPFSLSMPYTQCAHPRLSEASVIISGIKKYFKSVHSYSASQSWLIWRQWESKTCGQLLKWSFSWNNENALNGVA